jgi:hypothetical protein
MEKAKPIAKSFKPRAAEQSPPVTLDADTSMLDSPSGVRCVRSDEISNEN